MPHRPPRAPGSDINRRQPESRNRATHGCRPCFSNADPRTLGRTPHGVQDTSIAVWSNVSTGSAVPDGPDPARPHRRVVRRPPGALQPVARFLLYAPRAADRLVIDDGGGKATRTCLV